MKPVLVGLWYADQFCRPIRGATTMKKILLAIFILSTTLCFSQQELNVIPIPAKAELKEGTFTITSSTKITFTANGIEKSADFFNKYLKTPKERLSSWPEQAAILPPSILG